MDKHLSEPTVAIKPELRIPHNINLTEQEINILKKEKPRKGILG